MKRKLFILLIGVLFSAFGLAFAGCGENPVEENTPSLEYELLGESYAVVGLGDYEDGILNIPSQYNGKPVTAIGAEAFSYVAQIGVVIIPDSVTNIGTKAFYGCSNITEVTLGKNVTDIAEDAFAFCNNVETVTGFDSVARIGKNAFSGCVRLKTLEFSDSLKVIYDGAFENCTRLYQVTFGSGLEIIGVKAFKNCTALTGVEIPDGARTDVMDEAFFGCESVEYIRLGNDVINVGASAFEGCLFTREILLGDGIITIGERAFSACRKFYQITLGASLMDIGNAAFEKCWLLKEICNRSSVNVLLGTSGNGGVGYYAWYVRRDDEPTRISKDENGLVYYTEGTPGSEDYKKAVIAIELTRNTDVVIPDDVTEIADYAGYNEQLITGLVIGDGCVKIGDSAFRNTYKINKVVFGKNLTTIGDYAFRYNGYIVKLVVDKNLKTVGKQAFMKKVGDKYYKPYQTVYFEGSESEWAGISFASGNDHLLANTVTVAFYSEEEPTSSGTYWHYEDGKPTLW